MNPFAVTGSIAALRHFGLNSGIKDQSALNTANVRAMDAVMAQVVVDPCARPDVAYLQELHTSLCKPLYSQRTRNTPEVGGKFRETDNIGNWSGMPRCESRRIPAEMELLDQQMEELHSRRDMDVLTKATFQNVRIAATGPFLDGNHRAAWAVLNSTLLANGVINRTMPAPEPVEYARAVSRAVMTDDLRPMLNLVRATAGLESKDADVPVKAPFSIAPKPADQEEDLKRSRANAAPSLPLPNVQVGGHGTSQYLAR